MKSRYIILLSLIFGLLTGYLIYDYLIKVERSINNIQYDSVVVAAVDVPAKSRVSESMLELKKAPVEYIHPQAVRKKEGAVGAITVAPLIKGEQVIKNRITTQSEVKNGLAYLVPVGRRAVTVAVDEVSGVAGLIRPGDRVDVAATVNIPDSSGQREIPYSLVVLQDLQVLAVGKAMEDQGDGKNTFDSKTLTLAVTVEQSRPLILASQKGSIRLMLRSPLEKDTVSTTPFKAANFIQ